MTYAEIKQVLSVLPIHGCVDFILNRCVTGIPLEKRPIHLVDMARDKLMIRKDGWTADFKGKYTTGKVTNKIQKTWYDKGELDKMPNNINRFIKMKEVTTLSSENSRLDILSRLSNTISLKNNIALLTDKSNATCTQTTH